MSDDLAVLPVPEDEVQIRLPSQRDDHSFVPWVEGACQDFLRLEELGILENFWECFLKPLQLHFVDLEDASLAFDRSVANADVLAALAHGDLSNLFRFVGSYLTRFDYLAANSNTVTDLPGKKNCSLSSRR